MIVDRHELPAIRANADAADSTIALRFGCYDLLHEGHWDGLRFAREQADILVIGVASDAKVQRLKGSDRPVRPEAERIASIDEREEVAYSFLVPSPRAYWHSTTVNLSPDVVVDRPGNKLRAAFLGLAGIKYVIDEQEKVDSTTDIIKRTGLNPGSKA